MVDRLLPDVGSRTPGDEGAGAALEVLNLSKSFPGNRALDAVSFEVERGEIHALLGENGSGKSTVIKILSGFHEPDEGGVVRIAGHPLPFANPERAYALGCRFVHQDLGLIDSTSIVDNLSYSTGFPTKLWTIRHGDARLRAREALELVGLDIDPETPVNMLSPATKTGVAIARALRPDSEHPIRLLVLDEPTATLPDTEVHHLLAIVEKVASTGVGVLYVTHRLAEVFQIGDRLTVLRDGKKIVTRAVEGLTRQNLVALLVGEELQAVDLDVSLLADGALLAAGNGVVPGLEVRELSGPNLRAVSLVVRPGEIVGIAGITGSGSESILGSIFGAVDRAGGTVTVGGTQVAPGRPHAAMKAGVAYLPADRKLKGGVMDLTATENIALANLKPYWHRLKMNRRAERAEVAQWFNTLSIRPASGQERSLSTFSGGNQQKTLFGKWLRRRPTVLLLDEPTQGVDVGAKGELHRQIIEAASTGASVVIASTDVDELAALCHRVVVLNSGIVTSELGRHVLDAVAISHHMLHPEMSSV